MTHTGGPDRLHGSMELWARRMRAQFDYIRRQHHGESGRRREDDVREFLEAFLPARLAVGTGEIAASDGQVSPQIDLIVYDALQTPLLDRSESSIVVPVEGVYGVIEVSSRLSTSKLREDIEKIRAVKQLPKTAYFETRSDDVIRYTTRLWGREFNYFPIVGFCFAYEGANLTTLWQALLQIDDPADIGNSVDLVCSLSHGCIANGVRGREGSGRQVSGASAVPFPGSERFTFTPPQEEQTGAGLMLFYLLASSVLSQSQTRPIAMTRYSEMGAEPAPPTPGSAA